MKNILFAVIAITFSLISNAQCGTDEYNHQLVADKLLPGEDFVDYLERTRDFEFEESYDTKTKKAIRTIPVVFHVVHAYGAENVSKEQIEDQMRIINEDFQRTNADAANTRSVFQSRAANFEIAFKLARIAPDGSCTEGITRTYDPVNTIEDYTSSNSEVKTAVPIWDRSKYLNVWIVTEILSDGEGTILGYAQLPGQGASTDGVVMIHNRVGTIGSANAGDGGRTLTHEIGHWLGLYHPFQGGCSTNNNRTDRVDDTPPVAEPSYGCTAAQNPNTCSNDFPDEIDNVENFMDYANGGCMNMFTNGQLNRVEGYLASSAGRATNISAATHTATGINTNPSCGPIADFWYSSDKTTICAGGTVDFTDLSYNGDVATRTWTFAGGSPAVSSQTNPTVTYNEVGVYRVELEVSNDEGTDKISRDFYVTVIPSVSSIKAPNGEDFAASNALNGWEVAQLDAEGYGWELNTSTGYSGDECLEMVIDQNTPAGLPFVATMPPVDMTAYDGDKRLYFKYAYAARATGTTDLLLVFVSDDCGEKWKNLRAYTASRLITHDISPDWAPTSATDWGTGDLDLTDYADVTNLYVRFDVRSQGGNSIFIDDINVGSYPLSVPYYENDINLSLIPNPAGNKVTLKFAQKIKGGQVSIVDMAGRLLLQQNLDPFSQSINTSELTDGVYSVVVEADGKRWAKKLIISK